MFISFKLTFDKGFWYQMDIEYYAFLLLSSIHVVPAFTYRLSEKTPFYSDGRIESVNVRSHKLSLISGSSSTSFLYVCEQ